MPWTIRSITALAEHAEEWQALNAVGMNTPLLDFRFVHDLVSEFTNGSEVIAASHENGEPQAIGILRRTNRFCWQTLQPPNAPIGLWVSRRGTNIQDLLRRLVLALPPHCGMISITQQDPEGLARPDASSHLSTLDYIITASISVSGSFAQYLQGRSKNFRHNVTRQRNRLQREGINARLEFLRAPAEMARAVTDYSDLECASWKAQINSAVRIDEPQGRFYLKLMRSFADVGEALAYRYFFGDRLVASDLCIVRSGTLIILKTACDETIQGLSTAHLMRIEAFAELFDRYGIRRVEFYGPLKEWHTRLTDDVRQMYHINYYRWPVLKILHGFRRAGRDNAAHGGSSRRRLDQRHELAGTTS